MMSDLNILSIARTYAQAAFDYALTENHLTLWLDEFKQLAEITKDETIKQVLRNPKYTAQQRAEMMCSLINTNNEQLNNFIRILAENNRLLLLPEISKFFAELIAEHEKKLEANIYSVVKLDDENKKKLIQTLSEKTGRDVHLQCHIDPELIGGLLIRMGDRVIDYSIRGELNRMKQQLLSSSR